MRTLPLWSLLLLSACSVPALLGGQEGEPLGGQEGEPLAPPPADPDEDAAFETDGCEPTVSCVGDGWCAEYTEVNAPVDLEAACEAAGGELTDAPCVQEGVEGICAEPEGCGVVYTYGELGTAAPDFCSDLGYDYVVPRGN